MSNSATFSIATPTSDGMTDDLVDLLCAGIRDVPYLGQHGVHRLMRAISAKLDIELRPSINAARIIETTMRECM